MVVIELTATWSKLFDRTYTAAIAEKAGIDRADHTNKQTKGALRALAEKGLIYYDPATAHGQMSLVGLALRAGVGEK